MLTPLRIKAQLADADADCTATYIRRKTTRRPVSEMGF